VISTITHPEGDTVQHSTRVDETINTITKATIFSHTRPAPSSLEFDDASLMRKSVVQVFLSQSPVILL
jgi:hypothetical protein